MQHFTTLSSERNRGGREPNRSDESVPEKLESDTPEQQPNTNALYPETGAGGRGAGPSTTFERYDDGLSSIIGYENRDARGRTLSAEQRSRAGRLRLWNRRTQQQSSTERSTRLGLDEVQRMSSALGLSKSVREVGCRLFRQAAERGLPHGRSIEGVASACVYAATRVAGYPRSLDEIATVSRVGHGRIVPCYRALRDEFDLRLAPVDPTAYLPRICTNLDVPIAVQGTAEEMIRHAHEKEGTSEAVLGGANPVSIAAAALFAASEVEGIALTQEAVATKADVHSSTIRNNYPGLLHIYDQSTENSER